MRTYLCVAATGLFLALRAAAAPAYAAGPAEPGKNEQVVRDFYEAAINQKNFEAASKFLGPQYIQHNPTAGDGAEGLKNFIQTLRDKLPNYHSRIVRAFNDGDFVILHVHNQREPNTRGFAIVDIFRLLNGKIVEHWDVRQEIPETAANTNSMF
jgi:predicted SnoaL-like aldol condensation-catalyzing enzyme